MAYLTQVTVGNTTLDVGGGGTGGGSIDGYFNPSDDLFYEESTYTTAITGEANTIYISVDTNKSYRYNGSIFVRLDEESASGGHTIVNSSGTEMTTRSKLKFNTSLSTTDDDTNGQTVVAVDTMPSADMAEILDPLPGVTTKMPVLFDEAGTERQVGWYKLANGTKKPVYEKCFVDTTASTSGTAKSLTLGEPNIDNIISIDAWWIRSTGVIMRPYYYSNSDYAFMNTEKRDNGIVNVVVTVNNDFSRPLYVNVQYTKTTDTPA